MKRQTQIVLVLFVGSVAVALVAAAVVFFGSVQGAKEAHVPVVVVVRNPPALEVVWTNFRGRMEEFGYQEGRSIHYIVTEVAENLPATKQKIRTILEQEAVDAVYTMGISATRAAKDVTDEIGLDTPIVFGVVSDPVGVGLVQSMQSSGNNVTGVTPLNNLVASKRLEFLKSMLPTTKRIVYVWGDEKTAGVSGIRDSAPNGGLEFAGQWVANASELEAFLRAFSFREGDALLRSSDSVGASALQTIINFSLEKRIPLVGTNTADTERGALMSYGADYGSIGVQSARMMQLVLTGRNPADIPIEEADHFELAVNLDTAENIGINIPDSFLRRANHIISSE